jgi:hypothetical protein
MYRPSHLERDKRSDANGRTPRRRELFKIQNSRGFRCAQAWRGIVVNQAIWGAWTAWWS